MMLRKTSLVMCMAAAAVVGCGDDGGTTPDAQGGADAGAADGGTVRTFNVPLTIAEDGCAMANPGATGMATVTVAGDGSNVVVDMTFSSLSGAATLAHIHVGAAGATGNPVLTFPNRVSPVHQTFTSADYTAAAGAPTTWDAFITDLRAGGKYYINVHTAMCPGGELRGQID